MCRLKEIITLMCLGLVWLSCSGPIGDTFRIATNSGVTTEQYEKYDAQSRALKRINPPRHPFVRVYAPALTAVEVAIREHLKSSFQMEINPNDKGKENLIQRWTGVVRLSVDFHVRALSDSGLFKDVDVQEYGDLGALKAPPGALVCVVKSTHAVEWYLQQEGGRKLVYMHPGLAKEGDLATWLERVGDAWKTSSTAGAVAVKRAAVDTSAQIFVNAFRIQPTLLKGTDPAQAGRVLAFETQKTFVAAGFRNVFTLGDMENQLKKEKKKEQLALCTEKACVNRIVENYGISDSVFGELLSLGKDQCYVNLVWINTTSGSVVAKASGMASCKTLPIERIRAVTEDLIKSARR